MASDSRLPEEKVLAPLASLLCAALCLLGCRPDPPLPPDPDEPTPALTCADDPPLTLSRVAADSALAAPPWMQLCSDCPLSEVDVVVEDGLGGELAVQAAWTSSLTCVVGMPSDPLPARPSVPARFDLVDASGRAGSLDLDLAVPGGRGADPVDLGSGTWVLPLEAANLRLPGGAALLSEPPPAMLLSLGPADANAQRPLTFAPTRGDGVTQDFCQPTSTLSVPATLLTRQVAAPISLDDALPGGLIAERGAVQARLTESADALLDVTVLAVLNLAASESVLGMSPQETCSTWTQELGFDPCVPCGSPSGGLLGLPACVTVVIEAERAERASVPLVPLSGDNLPPNCRALDPSSTL